MGDKRRYLFSAIVGQDKVKTAYLANIVNPEIGGLLISGPKGTGKSTLVHSISPLLPGMEINEHCPFGCLSQNSADYCDQCKEEKNRSSITKKMKVVNLPLSVTEDRLIGTIDIEQLLTSGKKHIQTGILGDANNNILYIDEVNLLPDHIVDDILDVAASKVNTIEREGVSITHNSKFVLVGTMNPEEGDLRPQILDRFPLCVKAESIYEPSLRVEIIKRNILFENNYDAFQDLFRSSEETIAKLLSNARKNLPITTIFEGHLVAIASSCAELKVDGQRPDIIITKMAITLACMDERKVVCDQDVLLAAEMTINHRTRDGGLLDPPTIDEIHEIFKKYLNQISADKKAQTLQMKSFQEGINPVTGNILKETKLEGNVDQISSNEQTIDQKKK